MPVLGRNLLTQLKVKISFQCFIYLIYVFILKHLVRIDTIIKIIKTRHILRPTFLSPTESIFHFQNSQASWTDFKLWALPKRRGQHGKLSINCYIQQFAITPLRNSCKFKKKGYVLLRASSRHYRHVDHGQTNLPIRM